MNPAWSPFAAEDEVACAAPPDDADWGAMQRDGSSAARESIFLHYRPYAQSIAARLYSARYSRDVEFQDFQQLAYIGLLDAMERFDSGLGISFKTYCTPRIAGSVIDGIKRLSEAQEQISLKRRLQRERLVSLKDPHRRRRPLETLSELAIGLAIGQMLEGTGMFHNGEEAIRHDGYDAAVWHQTCALLRRSVEQLPPDMAKVIGYHYFDLLPFERIAGILGLSKGRISQIHRAGLALLRERTQSPHVPRKQK